MRLDEEPAANAAGSSSPVARPPLLRGVAPPAPLARLLRAHARLPGVVLAAFRGPGLAVDAAAATVARRRADGAGAVATVASAGAHAERQQNHDEDRVQKRVTSVHESTYFLWLCGVGTDFQACIATNRERSA